MCNLREAVQKPHGSSSRHLVKAAILIWAVFLAACQPSAEDRIERAQQYMNDFDYGAAVLELKNALRADPENVDARRLLGDASFMIADLATAEIEYGRAQALGADSLDIWLAIGRILKLQGRADEAFERVVPNLKRFEVGEATLVLVGDLHAIRREDDEAGDHYADALDINPGSAEALAGRAMLAARRGDIESGRRSLEYAVEKNPNSSFAWRTLGAFLTSLGHHSAAVDALTRAVERELPTTPYADRFSARVALASALIDADRLDEAQTEIDKIHRSYPTHYISKYLNGRLAYKNGDYELATTELQDYLASVPFDPRGQMLLGATHFSRGRLRQAEAYLLRAKQANFGGSAARLMLAETRLRLNKPELALDDLRALEQSGSADAPLLAMLGRAESEVGNSELALQYYERGLAEDPGNSALQLAAAAAFIRANKVAEAARLLESMEGDIGSRLRRDAMLIRAYTKLDQPDRALERGNKMVEENRNNADARSILGNLHRLLGASDRARESYTRAERIDPANLPALYGLASIDLEENRTDNAIRRLKRILELRPDHMPALISLAIAFSREKRLIDIEAYLTTAIQSSNDELPVTMLLGRIQIILGKLDNALETLAAAQVRFPEDAGILHLQSIVYRRKGDIPAALGSLERAAGYAPEVSFYYLELADTRMAAGDFSGAAASARELLRREPDSLNGLSLLVRAEIRAAKPAVAREIISDFAAKHTLSATISLLYGDVEMSVGNPGGAIGHYQLSADQHWGRDIAIKLANAHLAADSGKGSEILGRWVDENRDDFAARNLYALTLEREGQIKSAIERYAALYREGRLSAVGLNNLAWQYSLQGRDDALELAEAAYKLEPGNGSITDTLGWLLFREGDLDRALHIMRKAVELRPSDPEICYHLAAVLAKTGGREEAKEILAELINSNVSFQSRAEAIEMAGAL